MPNTPTTSFIPKQGPIKRTRHTNTRQVHVFGLLAYVAFVTSLLAAVGVFLYEGYVERQLEGEVNALSEEIKGFSDADMENVREFNGRLFLTKGRLDKGVSIVSVFSALEQATAKSVTIEQLSLKKQDDTSITLATQLSTDTFDSSLFQRGVFERNDVIDSVVISDLQIVDASDEGTSVGGIKFSAKLELPTEAVPVVVENVVSIPDVAPPSLDSAATSTAEVPPANSETI